MDDAVAIDDIKKFIADKELDSTFRYVPTVYEHHTEKVAVIGAGPAGMTCAYYLASEGYPVTVFDRQSAPGGMLKHGKGRGGRGDPGPAGSGRGVRQ